MSAEAPAWRSAATWIYTHSVFLDDWHEHDSLLSEGQRLVLARLELHPVGRGLDLWMESTADGLLPIVLVSLSPMDANLEILAAGIHVLDGRIQADRLHNQLFTLPDTPTSLGMEAAGPAEEVAARAVEWIAALVCRAVDRYEWVHQGVIYAERYVFSDTGENLCQMYNPRLPRLGSVKPLSRPGMCAAGGGSKRKASEHRIA
ncbi:hypothetical protein GCM10009555_011600 [Acrocarpospora macrocephala]